MDPVTAMRTGEHYPRVRLPPRHAASYRSIMALDPAFVPVPAQHLAEHADDAESLAELVADGTSVGATLPHGPRPVVIPDQALRAVEGLGAYGD